MESYRKKHMRKRSEEKKGAKEDEERNGAVKRQRRVWRLDIYVCALKEGGYGWLQGGCAHSAKSL